MPTCSVKAGHDPVTLRLPFAASSAATARQKISRWMTDNGSSCEHVEDAQLIVSELVANSILHASALSDGKILVSWAAEGCRGLRVSVTDGGSRTRPRMLTAPPAASAGRGMEIVDSLAISWWAERTHSRSTVHAVVSIG